MTDPLAFAFDVACPAGHAFSTWTSRIGSWWPRDHTVSGSDGVSVVMESGVGGRIYERTPDGEEHEWGRVTAWEPPHRLAYLWHLGRGRRHATEVEVRFVPRGEAETRIEIEHRGWERLGASADLWRERNRIGWTTLMPHFITATEKGVAS